MEMTTPNFKIELSSISLAKIKKLSDRLNDRINTAYSTYKETNPGHNTSPEQAWKIIVRALINTFGAVEVFVFFNGADFQLDEGTHREWIKEELGRGEVPEMDEPSDELQRPLIGGAIGVYSKKKRDNDFLLRKLWEQREIFKLPRHAHRSLNSFFEETNTRQVFSPAESRPKIITFYSYKGGMGRTTALAFVAKLLAKQGKKVFVIDCDLEAPGVHTLLCTEQPEKGLIDYLFLARYNRGLSIGDYVMSGADDMASTGYLHVLASGNVEDASYLEKLSYIDIEQLEAESSPNTFEKLFAEIQVAYQPDYILIDSRTGLTSIGGAMLFRYADQVVSFMGVSDQQRYGLRQLARHVQKASHVAFHWVHTLKPRDNAKATEQVNTLHNWLQEMVYSNRDEAGFSDELKDKLNSLGIQRREELEEMSLDKVKQSNWDKLYQPIVTHIALEDQE